MASIKVDNMALDNLELEPQNFFNDLCGVFEMDVACYGRLLTVIERSQ